MQVTVRRTGLLAVSRLLRELPNQTAVAELWVRAALPMVSTCMCQHPNQHYALLCSLTMHNDLKTLTDCPAAFPVAVP